MTIDELVENFPRLYHMAEVGTWESIRKHGLLSTTALLDLFEVIGRHRKRIESAHRPECVTITHPVYGKAVIRDQKPMRESTLLKCLRGLTPSEWYELLNRRTFFWLHVDRLTTLLNAKAYRSRAHCVITVETKALLLRHANRVTPCPINSGSTIYNPPPRNGDSFCTIADYPFEERRKTRGRKGAIAELVVEYSVPDIRDMVISVEHWQQNKLLERVRLGES
jgi:Family of unknown function (DUF7002)